MAVANGYGKMVTSGSVFMYDVGDIVNSFKGQPGTNITTGAGRNYNGYSRTTYENGVFFETNGYTEVVNIPALGPTTVQSVEINNSAGGVQCCPNLFNYTGGWMSPIWVGGQTYSYQIIYKVRSGYTHPNFMYHYEYTAGESYLTEYGVFTTDKQESLGDGWYHAWNTFTANASAAKGYTGLWYYNYNVADKVSIAAVSIATGNTIRPPKQIIPSGTTRSVTQGLLPIVGNASIDLTNISFNSTAQMVFDGTDDVISTTISNIPTSSNPRTIEILVKATGGTPSTSYYAIAGYGAQSSARTFDIGYIYADGKIFLDVYGAGGIQSAANAFTHNRYNLINAIYTGTTLQLYINGVLQSSNTYSINTASSNFLLGDTAWGYPNKLIGEIPIAKIYNRALSAAEVRQNYNNYKTRFNLP